MYLSRFFQVLVGIMIFLTALSVSAQENSLKGAWELVKADGEDPPRRVVRIVSADYFMVTAYDIPSKEFVGSRGGFYEFDGKKARVKLDFNTWDSTKVGQEFIFKVKFTDPNTITWKGKVDDVKINMVWKRIDDGNAPLAGAWQIGRRMGTGGEIREMTPGPRKTVKILSGTYFQWTAMNTETKEFMGCGGGTYTFENGNYTENIEFFSRNPDRVGASLNFQGSVEGDEWLHEGMSSRGRPIKEYWIRQ